MRNASTPGCWARSSAFTWGVPLRGGVTCASSRISEIKYYVHEKVGKPLIVADDDISGTFTFMRAMPDYGNRLDLTPAQIGQTWLNYFIENVTVLWWGEMGNSDSVPPCVGEFHVRVGARLVDP
jgi:hypothetical protein